MDIVPSCFNCGKPFTPRRHKQKYCSSCIEQSHLCIDCGVRKHRSVRGPRCKKCTDAFKFGKPNLKNRREPLPIEQVITEVESFGLLPDKQYAFGYVIGVVFGDGAISKDVHDKLRRSDGSPRLRPVVLYRIRLQVISQAFAERFANHWEILAGKRPTIMSTTRSHWPDSSLWKPEHRRDVKLFNVAPRHMLLGRYLAYLKFDSELYDLLRFPPDVMLGFMHGMIDSEGWVSRRNKRIEVSNKRATLLDVLGLMANSFGYTASVSEQPFDMFRLYIYGMPYVKFNL